MVKEGLLLLSGNHSYYTNDSFVDDEDDLDVVVEGLQGENTMGIGQENNNLETNDDFQYNAQRLFRVKTDGEDKAYCTNRISTAKYNLATFFPKFLLEQFSRYANLFFLFVALIQQLPHVSPTGRYTTLVPLVIVLSMTAIKELAEDWKRRKADETVNRRKVKVFRELAFKTVSWTDVKVGDVVKVLNNQFFPADLLLLSSSEPQAMCYVETANLDGETNLKIRQGVQGTANLISREKIRKMKAQVECEQPNERLYKFVGNIIVEDSNQDEPLVIPMGADQFLQRGAQLRNTPWVYGVVVYSGHETKLLKNNKAAPIKRSNVDNIYNRQIIYLFGVLIFLSVVSTIVYSVWVKNNDVWYLRSNVLNSVLTFFTFIILYNNIIPISLIITLDIVKYFQALVFINNDMDMYHEETDTPARARTSALNEELGQVQYVFSDKTGTLTQNDMRFMKCTVGGIAYGDFQTIPGSFSDPSLLDNLTNGHGTASVIRETLTLLAVCHTVIPERDRINPDIIVYQAASPDEAALVEAVKVLGFSFNVRQPDRIIINALGNDETFFILNILEFNSTRKRMSVIVRDEHNTIRLFCKGADSVVFERLGQKQLFKEQTVHHLHAFASEGLRTLCVAERVLTEEEYNSWVSVYNQASTSLVDRAQRLDDAAELIERDLFLLGATAIEDKLQDDVPNTISALIDAGIKVWVCTGDKQETAINIGFSCKLLNSSMDLLIVGNMSTASEMLQWCEEEFRRVESHHDHALGLVIDGHGLELALLPGIRSVWLALAKKCRSVICCRVSPLQKAEIVRLVRDSESAITLAIGDGANDVGMIQAAHVGIGISGNEGLQAARSSDYSIGQFKYLKKLLLVHGAWSYRRITLLILYSFYKNIALYLIEFWYAFMNGFSGQILFDRWVIALYNVLFTLLPPLAIGMLDQHLSAETLMAIPSLYRSGQRREHFNSKVFWVWTINSIYHSIILFFLPMRMLRDETLVANGTAAGQWVIGHIVYSVVVYTVTLKAAQVTLTWTKYHHIAIWGSAAIWFIFTLGYFELGSAPFSPFGTEVVGVERYMYSSARAWFLFFLFPFLALFPDFSFEIVRQLIFPSKEDYLRKKETSPHTEIFPPMPRMEEGLEDGTAQEHMGFAFSQNENTASVTQSDLVRVYDTTILKPDGE
eukprot:m.66930 g.66930  ORF g.66930 m.66930 type:complete len:1162 (+) comp8199_c0_seq1:30-3515(+)